MANATASTAVIFGSVLVVYFAIALVITALVRLAERIAGRGMGVGARL